jgi:DNA repair photolyase
MIISASRRTDIPAFYSEWFFNRLAEGYVLVANPFNPKMISRVSLSPEVIDCIVFWTKNPSPMLGRLDRLTDYRYYFQFTLNPYEREIENNLPALTERINIFKRLSDKIGREKIIWRYDPVLINEKYTVNFHREKFAEIAYGLESHTEKCILGFIDHYRHIRDTVKRFNIRPLLLEDIETAAISFRETINQYPIELETCTAKVDLSHLGIQSGQCIDKKLVEKIAGYSISAKKDRNQRDICRCVESIDIGAYESCLNGCIYCYAIKGNYNTAQRHSQKHDKNAPMLAGEVHKDDVIKERQMRSLRDECRNLF